MHNVDPYQRGRAANYDVHHRKSLRNRLTSYREIQLLGQAIRDSGAPVTAMDIPCGTGRFWSAFQDNGIETLWAFDASENMLQVAAGNRLKENYPSRLEYMSAFDLSLPEKSVDFTACLRFFHHLANAGDRIALLEDLCKVTRQHIALSLWVDGNFRSRRKMQRSRPAGDRSGYGGRVCRARAEVEAEFEQVGLTIVNQYDVWPRIAMWRLYLLKVPEV